MDQQFNTEILFKLKQRRRRKFWRRALSVMMCIVVFCTTYALILPAITQETETFCGIEAHTHTEDCFDKTLLCENHVHTDECVRQQEKLICTESTEPEHIHSEVCEPKTQTNLTCGMEETAGHSHS